jgi:hypothetical protein
MEHAQRGATPTRVGGRRGNHDVMTGVAQSTRQYVESLGIDAVVVRDQEAHAGERSRTK